MLLQLGLAIVTAARQLRACHGCGEPDGLLRGADVRLPCMSRGICRGYKQSACCVVPMCACIV